MNMTDVVEGDIADGSHVLVAVCYSQNTLAFSCYKEISNTIYCSTSHVPADELEEALNGLKEVLNPTIFLLHPRLLSNKFFLDMLLAGLDGMPEYYRFKVLKSSTWGDRTCTQLIHKSLSVKSGDRNVRGSQYQGIASAVDLDNEQCRQSLGALIAYMQESIFKLDEDAVTVADLRTYSQEAFLQVDGKSLNALQIFAEEVHPNVMKGKGRSKEGFSLFGLFDRTNSLPGRQRLRDWMSRPFCNRDKILHRQRGVALVSRQGNRDFVGGICPLMRHFHNLPRLLLRVKKVEASFVDWCDLLTSLITAQKLLDHVAAFAGHPMTDPGDAEYMRDMFSQVHVNEVHRLSHTLQSALDIAESRVEGTVVFQEGFDAALDRMRQVFYHLETHLIQAAHRVLEIAPLLQNVSVEYVPQVGYLVAVQESELHLLESCFPVRHNHASSADQVPPDVAFMEWAYPEMKQGYVPAAEQFPDAAPMTDQQPAGFRFVFQQAGVHYFKHPIVEELDVSVGDIKSDIADRQRTLLLGLEEILLDAEATLQQLSIALSTLDALISLGTLAVEQRLVAPEIVEQPGVVLIKAGRHLLQELTVDNFVPNDTFITAEKNVAMISGPNTSGKSVYIKQVALIVYLAHIGSFVPCERARIGLTDKIFTRITSTETVSAPQSAFALDLQQVNRMLHSATARSLCLVDEFGKGTMPVDGIALLAAVVKHFADKGGAAMFVLHFTEILHDAILSNEVMRKVSCFRMETMVQQAVSSGAGGDFAVDGEEQYSERTPLYVLKNGVATSSEGIPCARGAGVEESVLRRAAQVKYLVAQRQPIPPVENRTRAVLRDSQHVKLMDVFLSVKDWLSDEGARLLVEVKATLSNSM